MTSPLTLPARLIPLTSAEASHTEVGGKAINLNRLARAGYRVPDAFFVPTHSYRQHIEENNLADVISGAVQDLSPGEPESYLAASGMIQSAILGSELDPGLCAALELGWRWLGAGPVAVRSSATAEDLPGFSFAGQQETYLNVVSRMGLLEAVHRCWASLWTERAISYRDRNQIAQDEVALCVIVQRMVKSIASGVTFTANPVSGLRSETVIEATFGLGETLVSGKVQPDRYVVDRGSGAITGRALGQKAIALRTAASGGMCEEKLDASDRPAIPDKVVPELLAVGESIQELCEHPQDIEWAYTRQGSDLGEIFILQSRPITSLYPLPADMPLQPPRVMLSFGAVQGLLEPMTPLGWDAIRLIFAGGGRLFGRGADPIPDGVIRVAGHRLWVDVTGLVRNPIGARIVPRILEAVEPGSSGAMKQILNDERTGAGAGRLGIRALLRVSAFLIPWLWRVVWTAIWPGGVAEQIRSRYHHQIRALERRARAQRASKRRLRHALGLLRDLLDAFPYAVPEIASGAFAGLAPLFLLLSISRWLTGSSDLALKITRGLGHNVTTEMDLQLWEAARSIQADPDSRQRFQAWGAGDLAEAYLRRNLPVTAISAVDAFLDRYGMRGPGEIDIGRPRWREDPLPVFQTLKSYLEIEEGATAPDEIFRRGQREAVVAISELQAAARGRFGGRAVAHVIQWAARRVRSLAGLREAPKFYIVQLMGIMRAQLMKAGAEMARSGMIGEAGDIFFLRLGELEAIAGGEAGDWAGLIASRKEGHRRERRRERIPRLLLSDGRAVYEGLTTSGAQAEELRGSPVSPGVIQGQVRLVLSPGAAGLRPGEIMVCRGTDPAWTPLFLSAGGLIMEVGGMMTHGAIVAREYGIPAVVGVDRATERLRDGDRVEMDGSSGRIVRLS